MIKNKYFTIIIFASCLCVSACVSSNNAIYRETKRVQNSSQSATEMLQSEFEITKRALNILEKASCCLDADKPVSKETFCEIIEIISEFSDKCHQEKEDKVLFPFLKNAQGGEKKDFLGNKNNALWSAHSSDRKNLNEEESQIVLQVLYRKY